MLEVTRTSTFGPFWGICDPMWHKTSDIPTGLQSMWWPGFPRQLGWEQSHKKEPWKTAIHFDMSCVFGGWHGITFAYLTHLDPSWPPKVVFSLWASFSRARGPRILEMLSSESNHLTKMGGPKSLRSESRLWSLVVKAAHLSDSTAVEPGSKKIATSTMFIHFQYVYVQMFPDVISLLI